MSEFDKRLAVVTGASSGIGLAVTERLLDAGTTVIAMARRVGGLELLQEKYSTRLHRLKGDVTQASDLERLAGMARELGPVDFIVPNAGIAMLAQGTDTAAFNRLWEVNGAAALNTVAALKEQLTKPASVVFIGTFLSRLAFPGLAGYIASKTALISHARTLAVELAASDIRVNIVSPGPTATPIWGSLGLGNVELSEVASAVNSRLLDGKFLEPHAVADVILWLLSAGSRSIYGQEIVVDGGYTLR
ncbi:SDR family NAD(P)-dependent oxidoreductase [Pseudomonas sp. SLFW]|uniref:SDR family NAD(P)-dependent oxidoreductase n=1 Tax=Pseudomonas sp. SLFW TaxID=2683259 RepID=UPI00141350C4|nr:SDR family oxidoreductase [Pseudomonas sp. SLFW]NBB09871.1 SDR family oxidoreductase [Pseudomonas sp. SLFW]